MTTAAERQRAYRRRRRTGEAVFRIIADEVALAEFLIGLGRLDARSADDRPKVERAFAEMVREMLVDRYT